MKKKDTAHIYSGATAPDDEQRICVTCGFCCDATLFLHACLNPGERGHLPEKMEEASFTEEGRDYFRQPCSYFSGHCTIYGEHKADVCSSYRCQLLKDFAGGELSLTDALDLVREAIDMRSGILAEYARISGKADRISFREVLIEIGKLQELQGADSESVMAYDLLTARCNILEALLIKKFRSAEGFGRLIMDL